MTRAIEDPAEVERMGTAAIALRDDLIHPFAAQLAELFELYDELLARPASARQVSPRIS